MFSIQKLFGKDEDLSDLLEASAVQGQTSARALNRLLQSTDAKPTLEEFAAARRKDKEITQEIGVRLVKALVTTIDREDIESLSSALYKIPKSIEKFAERFLLVAEFIGPSDFSRQAYMVEEATAHVVEIVQALHKNANLEKIKDINDLLQQVEGDADKLMLTLYQDLYSGKYEPMKVIALKDLYEILEKVIDRCRDAGNAVTQIVLKHS
jgi:uncharacterized protein Yka (UPF0111/DUF47 family)